MKITKEPVTVDENISLSKLTGKAIKDILGYASDPHGWGTIVFVVSRIVFEDGTELFLEGEHDLAYLPPDSEQPNMDEDTLLELSEQDDE